MFDLQVLVDAFDRKSRLELQTSCLRELTTRTSRTATADCGHETRSLLQAGLRIWLVLSDADLQLMHILASRLTIQLQDVSSDDWNVRYGVGELLR